MTQVDVYLLQSLVGVAGGATRAALTLHQARRDNMADISAKDGSQVLDCVFLGSSWVKTVSLKFIKQKESTNNTWVKKTRLMWTFIPCRRL